jgi:phosphoribosylglycinamide formyltransferase-1
MGKKCKVAVLVSGRGSNLQSLIDACREKDYPAEIVLVLSNKTDAYALERAKSAGIATQVISHKDFENRELFDKAMDQIIRSSGADIVCMAGFMRLLSSWFVSKWKDKLINIHPSLLPSFKGLNTHQRVLDAGVKLAGCTVHFVREEMDVGPIIVQVAVPVFSDDTQELLSARVLEQEHHAYALALKLVASGEVRIEQERVISSYRAQEGILVGF